MKLLCEYLGGSHLYGTNTPDSDIDTRGVFMNTDPSKILGLDRFDHEFRSKTSETDVSTERNDISSISVDPTLQPESLRRRVFQHHTEEWK
jgi:predicted nucleotidyltransferase